MSVGLRAVGATAALAVAVVVLATADAPLPPLAPQGLEAHPRWWADSGPPLAAAGALRLVGLVLVGRIAASSGLAVIAAVTRRRTLADLAHRLAPAAWRPVIRPLVAGAAVGLVLTTSVPVGGGRAASADPAPTPPIVMRVDDASASPDRPDAAPVMHLAQPAPAERVVADASSTPVLVMRTATPAPSPAAPTPIGPRPSATHLVRPGDNLWSIAAEAWAAARGTTSADPGFLPYWRACIDANLDRLVRPGDPGHLLPGQELLVPAVPAAP